MEDRSSNRLLLWVIAISVIVAVVVGPCQAASIGSLLEDEVLDNNRINGTGSLEDDDYYSAENEYDYKDENTGSSANSTSQSGAHPLPPSSTSTTTASTTTTAMTAPKEEETNLIGLGDAPTPQIQTCPLACRCETGTVNCSGLQLNRLPADLPENLIILDLSGNLLEEIDLSALVRFKELRELNLSHNAIHGIQKLAGEEIKLPLLSAIDLEDNKLEGVLDPDTFLGLTGLKKLTLSNNSISVAEGQPLFNLPSLEELYLRNCSMDELYTEMFAHMEGLKVLDMSDNPPYKSEPDTNTFEPLTLIKRLNLGVLQEEQVLELCTMLTTIDVIHFPEFRISCFEYVNGYTFEQSMVSNTPQPELEEPYAPPVAEPDNSLSEEVHGPAADPVDEANEAVHKKDEVQPRALGSTTTTSTSTTEAPPPTEDSTLEKQTGEIDHDLMNQILLIIVLLAFIGLVIGVIFRRDYCGIKTKCCRTRRASQTDQVTPAPEEVPLNKVTTVPVNGTNGNGAAVTTPLNGNQE